MKDTYKSITGPTDAIYKEKGSRFIAYAYPVNTREEVEENLSALRKKYHDARHVCYAYRIGIDGEIWRANDDGEPSNSAGAPIFNTIRSFELTNVLVAVVRYFGGVKLGVSGLIEAYKISTEDALNQATVKSFYLLESFTIAYPYDRTAEVERAISKYKLKAVSSEYMDICRQIFEIRKNDYETVKEVFDKMGILE